jgi:hypothetical protein
MQFSQSFLQGYPIFFIIILKLPLLIHLMAKLLVFVIKQCVLMLSENHDLSLYYEFSLRHM